MRKCTCDMRTRLVGDGCEACNPELALEYAKETIVELEARVERLEEALRFILDECDWEPTHHESGGDERIGAVARRALEEK